ncbi:MAG TPA: hypothetical protein VGL61_06925 [Kofleriaceae bacterium]|jgi:uncharacterized membrane-anchored protein
MSHSAATKLAPVVASFWVMKIAATTLGETAGDLISMTLHVGYAASSLILISIFVVTLGCQLAARRYHPALYWTVILATSMAGTTMSDYMDRTLALGYPTGAALLLTLLLATLAFWRIAFGSLSVDDVRSRRVELVYWIAILFSNTLGTALGDFLSDSSGLGFAGGAILIGGLLLAVLLATAFTRISRVFLFWVAFVLTRPFGATVGDVLTKPHDAGGLALGTAGSSAALAAVLVLSVALATLSLRRQATVTASS